MEDSEPTWWVRATDVRAELSLMLYSRVLEQEWGKGSLATRGSMARPTSQFARRKSVFPLLCRTTVARRVLTRAQLMVWCCIS